MAQQPFDPNQFISKVKGRDYLEVKWRIAWMRHEHPDTTVETELITHVDDRAIMRARVILPTGGSATGWGSETASAFENYIEKAETKAIGRALTALGYGTPGVSESDDTDHLLQKPTAVQHNALLATAPQRSRIQRLASELSMDASALNSLVREHTGGSLAEINKRQASGIIDLMESRRPNRQRAS